jgi:hypothetical protein
MGEGGVQRLIFVLLSLNRRVRTARAHTPFPYSQLAAVMRHQDIRRLLICPLLDLKQIAGQKEENKDFYFFNGHR